MKNSFFFKSGPRFAESWSRVCGATSSAQPVCIHAWFGVAGCRQVTGRSDWHCAPSGRSPTSRAARRPSCTSAPSRSTATPRSGVLSPRAPAARRSPGCARESSPSGRCRSASPARWSSWPRVARPRSSTSTDSAPSATRRSWRTARSWRSSRRSASCWRRTR